MASLRKRGKYYYIRFVRMIDGLNHETSKSLGITKKNRAKEACQLLEEMEERGEIDPFADSFNPQRILEEQKRKKKPVPVHTVREAADYFYRLKSHLSDKTIRNDSKNRSSKRGAYERAVEHFISLNDIEKLPVKHVGLYHFEKVIFKPGIKSATRHFYYRQLRVFWNTLRDRDIVSDNYFKTLKKDLPDKKSNMRPKMISEDELQEIFEAFDTEVERKKQLPEWKPYHGQRWFKPLMCCYFYGGLRKNEAGYDSDIEYSGLQGKNLYYDGGELAAIYLEATKGRNERLIPINDKWKKHLLTYLDIRGKPTHDQHVFIYLGGSKKGWPVTGDRAYRQFKRYIKLAGLPKSRTLHGMRHERITSWLEQGFNTSEAQFMAGHSSSNVTNKYTHLRAKNLLKKQRDIDGRDNS